MDSESSEGDQERVAASLFLEKTDDQSFLNLLRGTGPFQAGDVKNAHRKTPLHFLTHLLRNAMLSHRWSISNDILTSLTLSHIVREDSAWRCGWQVICNHPNSTPELIELYFLKLSNFTIQHACQKFMEHIFFLLSQNLIEESYRIITNKTALRRNRLQEKYQTFDENWAKLTAYYTGMIDYVMWASEFKGQSQEESQREQEAEGLEMSEVKRIPNRRAARAVKCFESVLTEPGVWDIFVQKHVEMLEHYGYIVEGRNVYQRYLDRNRDNPNAHKYLYHYMKSHGISEKERLAVLHGLVKLVPSDELAFELYEILRKKGKKHKVTLPILFEMVEHECWKDNLRIWNALAVELIEMFNGTENDLEELNRIWSPKATWWPHCHFKSYHIRSMKPDQITSKLLNKKAIVASLLCPDLSFAKLVQKRMKQVLGTVIYFLHI